MKNLPYVNLPFCDNSSFENAVKTVEMCRSKTKCFGFEYPFFAPGGGYGDCWWSLDYALAIDGYKWIDTDSERDFVMNMSLAQESDGRIKLYGIDRFDSHFRDKSIIVSSIPKYFETAYSVFRRTDDENLKKIVYTCLTKNLGWWKKNRFIDEISLYYAIFEETFVPNTEYGREEYCPVDLNMQIVRGLKNTAKMAEYFGDNEIASELSAESEKLLGAINKYLWNAEKGAFYPYMPQRQTNYDVLMASSFDGLMFGNADSEQKNIMLDKLRDNSLFGWDEYTITTFAKNEPMFSIVRGDYNGNPSWSGSVWTLTNRAVIQALEESGEYEIAAELCKKTICEFKNNYTEFICPLDGEGEGVKNYAWTASQFIQIIIENIFGISYDAVNKTLTVKPNLCADSVSELYEIKNLVLPDGNSLSVKITDGKVNVEYSGDFAVIA